MPDKTQFDRSAFDKEGFARIPRLLEIEHCTALAATFDEPQAAGIRHLIDHPAVRSVIEHSPIGVAACEILGRAGFAYKATLFDKHMETNWLVAWHQDISIPVQQRFDIEGWTGWSRKDDVLYVQPPTEVLSRLLALRINLDDCDDDNGPLRVLVGSHRLGRLKHGDIPAHIENHREEAITGLRGSAMLMRPLLIHASSKATNAARRRVLHLEFAAFELPAGLEWHRRPRLSS